MGRRPQQGHRGPAPCCLPEPIQLRDQFWPRPQTERGGEEPRLLPTLFAVPGWSREAPGLGKHPASKVSGLGVQGESSQRAGLRQAMWRGHPSEDSDYRLTCLLDGCLGSGFCVLAPWAPTSLPATSFLPQPSNSPPLHSPVLLVSVPLLCPQPLPPPQGPPYFSL